MLLIIGHKNLLAILYLYFYTPLVLYKHAMALQVLERVIGSHGLPYSKLSIVFAKRLESDRICLAEVKYYGAISIVKRESDCTR